MSTFALTVYRKELNYDVQQYTYKVGQSRLTDADAKTRFEIQIDGEAEDQLDRWYKKASADIKGNIKLISRTAANAAKDDKRIVSSAHALPDSYVFTFDDAERLRKDVAEEATNYIHEYLVASALTEWFKQVLPNESAACAARAEEVNSRLERLFYTKTTPSAPTYSE